MLTVCTPRYSDTSGLPDPGGLALLALATNNGEGTHDAQTERPSARTHLLPLTQEPVSPALSPGPGTETAPTMQRPLK